MIFQLRQARDRDRAHQADPAHLDRERAAGGGVVGGVDMVALGQTQAALPARHAHVERAVAEAVDDRRLAANPVIVVDRRARQRDMKELLMHAAQIDGQHHGVGTSALDQHHAETESVVIVEAVELQPSLLLQQLGQQSVVVGHPASPGRS